MLLIKNAYYLENVYKKALYKVVILEYNELGKKILDMDSAIRFVTIFDTKDGKILYSEHTPGTTNLLSKEESQESLQLAINAWKTRSNLAPKIGKGKYVLAEYEKIKRITMPYDENHLLYITTDFGSNSLDLIDKIRNLWPEQGYTSTYIF